MPLPNGCCFSITCTHTCFPVYFTSWILLLSFFLQASSLYRFFLFYKRSNRKGEKDPDAIFNTSERMIRWFLSFSLSLISQLQSKVKLKALHRDLDIYTCTYVSRKGRKEGDAIKTRVIIRDYAGIFRVEWHAGGGVAPAFVNRTSRAHPLNSIRFALIFSYTPAR